MNLNGSRYGLRGARCALRVAGVVLRVTRYGVTIRYSSDQTKALQFKTRNPQRVTRSLHPPLSNPNPRHIYMKEYC